MRKKTFAISLVICMLCSSLSVYAATPKYVTDCRASITLERWKGVFLVFEDGTPINPITPKKIDGNYKCVDIDGYYNTQRVSGQCKQGQLAIDKYAPDHYISYMGNMAYYLNGNYEGSVTKYY